MRDRTAILSGALLFLGVVAFALAISGCATTGDGMPALGTVTLAPGQTVVAVNCDDLDGCVWLIEVEPPAPLIPPEYVPPAGTTSAAPHIIDDGCNQSVCDAFGNCMTTLVNCTVGAPLVFTPNGGP